MLGESGKLDYAGAITEYLKTFYSVRKADKQLSDDKAVLVILDGLASMLKHQIHEVIVKENALGGEEQIRNYLNVVIKDLLPACRLRMRVRNKEIRRLYLELYKRFFALVAFRSAEHFAYYMDWDRPDDKKVWKYVMPAMRGIFHYGTKMILGQDVKRMRASCPVSYGKSYSFNLLAVFALGVDPQFRVLTVTESDELVRAIVFNCKKMICSKAYAEVFPAFEKHGQDESQIFSISTNKSFTFADSLSPYSFIATTRLGSSNGLRCDLLILDDLTKGETDRLNVKVHNEIVKQYDNVWNARSDGLQNNRVILGGTMWADYDLLNEFERRVRDRQEIMEHPKLKYTRVSADGKNVFIGVPNLDYDTDESTYPQKFPTEELRDMRDNILEPAAWWARCQQKPLPPVEMPFQWNKVRQYDTLPESGVVYAALDPPRTGKNYLSMLIFRKVDGISYLVDCVYEKETLKNLLDAVCRKLIFHEVFELLIEINVDTSVGELIRKRCAELAGYLVRIATVFSTDKKEDKIFKQQDNILMHVVFPKKGMYARTSQMGTAMEHITLYNFEKKVDYDDAPDTLSMYTHKYHDKQANRVITTFDRRARQYA